MDLVSIKIKKHILDGLKLLKSELKKRSISDVIEFLLDFYLTNKKAREVSYLLSDIKTRLDRVIYIITTKSSKTPEITTNISPTIPQEVKNTTQSSNIQENTTYLPPTNTTEIPPSVPTEALTNRYVVRDLELRDKLNNILSTFLLSSLEYEIYLVDQEKKIYALALRNTNTKYSALFIPKGEKQGFWLGDIIKKTLNIRTETSIILAIKATTKLTIKIYDAYAQKFVSKFTIQ